ncbi:hypothetical protein IAR55_002471 [Kwoniella newhampshirensis]|uniref:EKC/KEOPS complex subunit CGI121 n=1 Tax=Kwoniella newhampshirensis TaxID=1651941 RepID=A0AAW0YR40_9TREE
METYTLPNFPSDYSTIHLALFTNVTNSPQIRRRLIEASVMEGAAGDKARAEVDFGFIEADLLVSKEHLLTAILSTLLYSFPTSTPSTSASSSDPPTSDLSSLDLSSSILPTTSSSTTTDISTPPFPSSHSLRKASPKTRSHNLHSELLLSLSPNNNITDSIRRHGISDSTTTLAVVRFGSADVSAEEVCRGMESVVQGESVGWERIEGFTDWSRVDKVYKLNELNALKSPDVEQKKKRAVISSVAIKNVI